MASQCTLPIFILPFLVAVLWQFEMKIMTNDKTEFL
jgi:hypothetical protein